jgi:hypothetical protein
MGIAPALNQACSLLDSVEKPDVLHWNAQLFTAGFVVFDDAKPEVHGIESAGGKRLASQHLYIGQWQFRQWKRLKG